MADNEAEPKRGAKRAKPRDLVVVMAGDKSLHREFVEGREFELWVIYYGDSDQVAEDYRQSCDRFWRAKGLKLELVRKVLLEDAYFAQGVDYSQYRYVFLPDDDIRFDGGAAAIHALFATAAEVQADMFQPAIQNEYASFNSTLKVTGAVCHLVNWVENMMPAYTGELFRLSYLATVHALEYLKSGWGAEVMAAKIAETVLGRGVRAYVIDACPVIHTRPVGQNSVVHEIGRDEAFLNPQMKTNNMRTVAAYRTTDAAVWHTKDLKPSPRNLLGIELYMQRTRFARKLWANLLER